MCMPQRWSWVVREEEEEEEEEVVVVVEGEVEEEEEDGSWGERGERVGEGVGV